MKKNEDLPEFPKPQYLLHFSMQTRSWSMRIHVKWSVSSSTAKGKAQVFGCERREHCSVSE
jgi:hypothetical protein